MREMVRDGLATYLSQEEEKGRQEMLKKINLDSLVDYNLKEQKEEQGRPEDQSIKLRY